ncbi:hypothetical protein PFISCL1PPCAC_7314, partial [Pristionchus fissidentatus]
RQTRLSSGWRLHYAGLKTNEEVKAAMRLRGIEFASRKGMEEPLNVSQKTTLKVHLLHDLRRLSRRIHAERRRQTTVS